MTSPAVIQQRIHAVQDEILRSSTDHIAMLHQQPGPIGEKEFYRFLIGMLNYFKRVVKIF